MNKPQKLRFVYIPKNLNIDSVLGVIFAIHKFVFEDTIDDNTSIVISFSHTEIVTPSGLTPLLCYLRYILNVKENFHGGIVHSNNSETDNLIARMGFYNSLGLTDDFDWNKDAIKLFKELYCFSNSTPEEDVISVNEDIIYSFTKQSKKDNYKKALSWCIPELVDNARTHSNSEECVLFAQKFSRGNYTEFCIADCGVGIQETMGDADAITAIKRCISQAKGINSKGMGNGLYFTAELIKKDFSKDKSYLRIVSGNVMLELESGTEPIVEKIDTYWQGTIVTLTLNDSIQSSIEKIKGSEVELTEDLPNFYC